MLRTVIANADRAGESVFLHYEKPTKSKLKPGTRNLDFNKLMQNVGAEHFDYGTFRAAFETDPRVKTMTADFNSQGVELKTKRKIDKEQGTPTTDNGDVNKMAKNATDLGKKL